MSTGCFLLAHLQAVEPQGTCLETISAVNRWRLQEGSHAAAAVKQTSVRLDFELCIMGEQLCASLTKGWRDVVEDQVSVLHGFESTSVNSAPAASSLACCRWASKFRECCCSVLSAKWSSRFGIWQLLATVQAVQ